MKKTIYFLCSNGYGCEKYGESLKELKKFYHSNQNNGLSLKDISISSVSFDDEKFNWNIDQFGEEFYISTKDYSKFIEWDDWKKNGIVQKFYKNDFLIYK